VRVSETTPETMTAAMIVTENSCSRRPTTPPMKKTGRNTAIRDSVIDRIVNPISRDPFIAASSGPSPDSTCRAMFSIMTIASSTTNPTDKVIAINDRLSSEYPHRYITGSVPSSDSGSAMPGIRVAQ